MKCNNCSEDLVIPEGKDAGHCVHCGASFTVEAPTGKQTFDDSVIDRIADKVFEKLEAAREAARTKGVKHGKKGKAKPADGEPEGDPDSVWSE